MADIELTIGADGVEAERALRKVERSASATARSIADRFGKASRKLNQSGLVAEIETVGSLFIQLGGNVSKAAILFTSMVRPIATVTAAFGPMGIAIAAGAAGALGGALAISKMSGALVEAGQAAADAGARLSKLNLATQEQKDIARDAENAITAASVATDRLTLAIAKNVTQTTLAAEAWTGLKSKTASAAETILTARKSVFDMHQELVKGTPIVGDYAAAWVDLVGPSGNLGMIPGLNQGFKWLAASGREAADEIERAARAAEAFVGPENIREGIEWKTEQERKRLQALEASARERDRLETEAQRKREEKAREHERRMAAITKAGTTRVTAISSVRPGTETAASVVDAAQSQLGGREVTGGVSARQSQRLSALSDEYTRAQMSARELRQEQRGIAKEARLVDAATARGLATTEELQAIRAQNAAAYFDTVITGATAVTDVLMQLGQQELDQEVEVLRQREDRLKRHMDRRKELRRDLKDANTDAEREEIKNDLAATKIKIGNAEKAENRARRAALKTWRANQKMQLAAVGVNAAAAFGMAMATTPLPPPASIAAAGIAAGAVGAQAIVIASQKPPSFHVGGRVGERMPGGAPDEVGINALRGETVLTRRQSDALDRMGGSQMLDGTSGTGGSGEMHVHIHLDGKEIARRVEQLQPGRSRYNFHAGRK